MTMNRRRLGLWLAVVTLGVAAWPLLGDKGLDKKDTSPPPPDVAKGVIATMGDVWFDIVVDDDKQHPVRYAFTPAGGKIDAKSLDMLHNTFQVGCLVQITWSPVGTTRLIKNASMLAAPGKFGKLTGTVTACDKGTIDIKGADGKTEKYMPRYILPAAGQPGVGGFDPDMTKVMAGRCAGDEVQIHWTVDDHIRVTSMKVIALSKDSNVPNGTVVGSVVDKTKESITVKLEDGSKETYSPQLLGSEGQMDADLLRLLAGISANQRVEVKWFQQDGKRFYSLRPPPRAGASSKPASAPAKN